MYLIGRPWMPPLSLTQSKYALATLPTVVKSTPGISIAMPPILMGAPVAFLPVPAPHDILFAVAAPAVLLVAPEAHAASDNATTQLAAQATPIEIFLDRISLSSSLASWSWATQQRHGERQPQPSDHDPSSG